MSYHIHISKDTHQQYMFEQELKHNNIDYSKVDDPNWLEPVSKYIFQDQEQYRKAKQVFNNLGDSGITKKSNVKIVGYLIILLYAIISLGWMLHFIYKEFDFKNVNNENYLDTYLSLLVFLGIFGFFSVVVIKFIISHFKK